MNINQDYKAYKFKLKTNAELEAEINGYVGCSRFVWNKALALIKARLENQNIEKIVRKNLGSYFKPLDLSKADKKIAKEQQKLDCKQHSRKKGSKTKKSKNYIKQNRKVALAHKNKADTRYDYLHKVSAAIAKNHGFVAVENLNVSNMTRTAKGTAETPGRNVKAKSGLNRSILAQSWSMLYDMLEYKLLFNGGRLVRVDPAGTSQECPVCHNKHKDNRKTQEAFSCISCGFFSHADLVGSVNTLTRALPDYNFKIPQGLREFTPVEYSRSFKNGNEADNRVCRQQQEPPYAVRR